MSTEINFDGLIGPSHNYGGLSHGNVASKNNALRISQPKKAALQGLQKMNYLRSLGLEQGVLLPQQRPHLPTLRALGFMGSDREIIEKASNQAPEVLAQCYSASSMWTANACTVSPSADSRDGRVHFTSANLSSMFHRSIEHGNTSALLRSIFSNDAHFVHHDALPAGNHFGDEGAANHNRFATEYDSAGVQLFVFGRYAFRENRHTTAKFPTRQTFEASQAIARLHQLNDDRVVYAQQNPKIVDAGAFHNDVVSVSNLNAFFMHEEAFVDSEALRHELSEKFEGELAFVVVPTEQVSLESAVKSYLFNSQLIKLPNEEGMALILPEESRENSQVYNYLQGLENQSSPIKQVKFVDVRQSMQNGGGPACLRLRVALTQDEVNAVNPRFLLDDALLDTLNVWVSKHYRDEIQPADLSDPSLAEENFAALDELTQIFDLGSFYEFQR
ncbi:N-succinylarginine dihydrolase [Arenicella sp. 4NH20-0111]|uniref:N-succinylarginine dihydrolase n=1 Tax=Arenicella sp. 4NH20-0111 TaxID=3127648 RepID=UPI003103AA11